jgi:hypothetical protein
MKVSEFVEEISRKWWQAALAGDFATAWSASDEILRAGLCFSNRERWRRSLWDGSPFVGRNVLIRCWRGLGDAIHFIRYAPLVRAKARSLSVEAPGVLVPLLTSVSGIDRLVELDTENFQNTHYVQMESTELPYVFRTTLDSIPCNVPYIHIEESRLQMTTKKVKIGLCWCGGSYDPRRALHLSDLEPLTRVPELAFFQLQRGAALQEILGSSFQFENPSDCSMDLSVTASLINSLDVIVSVDTMVAHLAGALGKKVYLLLHTEADWRWLNGREDSPWYPTVSLLRQFHAGDWKPVVNRLTYILGCHASKSAASVLRHGSHPDPMG